MSWVRLDDGFADHQKVLDIGEIAFRLHVCAMCWAGRRLTDGLIKTRDLPILMAMLKTPPSDHMDPVNELLDAGLWDDDGDGWSIHDWKEYNPEAAKVIERREANARRQRRFKSKDENGNALPNASITQDVTPLVTRPRPNPVPSQSHSRPKDPESKPIAGEPSLPLAIQTSLLPGEPSVVRQTRAKKPRAESKTGDTWMAYAESYARRYGEPPLRNAKINGQLAQLVAQMGADSPGIAAHYLASASAYYVTSGHSVGLLLRDCQKLRTEMQTGQRINAEMARRNENTEANPFAQELLARMKARKEAEQNGK